MRELRHKLMTRFGVSALEADRMIGEAQAKASVRTAVAAATRGEAVAAPAIEGPGDWRAELQRRQQAVEVLRDGLKSLRRLQKLVSMVLERENKCVQHKISTVNDQQLDWWDFRKSGWAMGGREAFAQEVADLLHTLDEPKLAGQVLNKIGFKRSVPLPELPRIVDEAPSPRDAQELEELLVQQTKAP